MLFKICNKNGGNAKCLGVVGGSTAATPTSRSASYTGAAGQTWTIAQTSSGVYKIINKSSGMSLDVSGTQVVQKPYTNQAFPISYFADQPGLLAPEAVGLEPTSCWTNWSTNDGTLVTTVSGQDSADCGEVDVHGCRPRHHRPGQEPTSWRRSTRRPSRSTSPTARQNNGTTVQAYDSWGGDPSEAGPQGRRQGQRQADDEGEQQQVRRPVGRRAHLGHEPRDSGLQRRQQPEHWITGETAAGSGVFMLKNVAAPGLCVNVPGTGNTTGGFRSPPAPAAATSCSTCCSRNGLADSP